MVAFKEDHINPDATEVHYQSPEDLRNDTAEPKVVVHDDENPAVTDPVEIPNDTPAHEDIPFDEPTPEIDHPIDSEVPENIPCCNRDNIPCCHTPTPIDRVKMDPENIIVAGRHCNNGDRFFVDGNDVKAYSALHDMDITEALNDIIRCNEDTGMTIENTFMVVDETTMDHASAIEESGATCIRFVNEDEVPDIAMDVEIGSNDKEVRVSEDPQEANPVDAVKRQYNNVVVAKQGDEFFTDVEDVQKCADIRHESVIEVINGIISCNEESGVDADNITCIVKESTSDDTISSLIEAGINIATI